MTGAGRSAVAIGSLLALGLVSHVVRGQDGAAPAVSPIAAVRPLFVAPPEIVVEAGILPSVPILSFLDALDEWVERNVFSFGIPALRVRIMLSQLAERTAELQALERAGRLTPSVLRALVGRHERLLAVVNRGVSRGIARGKMSAGVVFLFIRTRLAAADVFEELREERAVLRGDPDDVVPPAAGAAAPSGGPVRRTAADDQVEDPDADAEVVVDSILREIIEKLSDVEGDVLTSAASADGIPSDILRVLAGQQVAKAERDLLRAGERTSDRRAVGNLVIAEAEVRSAAESSLTSARKLAAEGHPLEALALAKEAKELAARLASGELTVRPDAQRAHEKVDHLLRVLVDEGVISLQEQAAAGSGAHQAIDEARR